MGQRPRQKPKRLSEKLMAIRQTLALSQSQLGLMLGFTGSFNRVSEFESESGNREPNLIVLLAYAKVARVSVEVLIDDKRELPERFKQRGKDLKR